MEASSTKFPHSFDTVEILLKLNKPIVPKTQSKKRKRVSHKCANIMDIHATKSVKCPKHKDWEGCAAATPLVWYLQ